MKISKIDVALVVIVGTVLGFLFLGSGKKLGADVPDDEVHRGFYRQPEAGEKRMALEKGCVSCHEIKSLPEAHPHKEECMVCHRPKE